MTAAPLDPLERLAPRLFLLLSLLTSLFLAWNLPPFQGADELVHIDRAEVLAPYRTVENGMRLSGGDVDPGVNGIYHLFEGMRFHPGAKARAAAFAQAAALRWQGQPRFTDFRSAAIYPPIFYTPAAVALDAGKALRLSITQTLYLARAAQALAFALVGFWALTVARGSRLFLFSVLMLPMSQALAGAVTSDALLIATVALAAALVGRSAAEGRPATRGELFGAAACLALAATPKPPYALFGLVLLAVRSDSRRDRVLAATAVFAAMLAWQAIAAATVSLPLIVPGVDPGRQLAYLAAHPLAVPELALATIQGRAGGWAEQFVGVLGWLDTRLPGPYYGLAWAVLLAAAALSAGWRREPGSKAVAWAVLAAAVLTFGAVEAAFYLTWTPVGGPVVEGMQGRHLLPMACLLAVALEGRKRLIPETGAWARLRLALGLAVLAFPALSLLVVQRAVILRYYLG